MAFIADRKNIRVCQVTYDSHDYDVVIGIDNMDQVDDILTAWAKQEFGVLTGSMTDPVLPVPLDLPAALLSCKNLDSCDMRLLDIDNYAYITGV